jgi:maltose alpha-D-glucosyltransferase/alpha-amylase
VQPLWYRNAVVYQVDVAMFRDANGDGWGDLPGVTERLEHVRGLGANAVWLLPFYRTPYRDGGYDITDHLRVDDRFGDNADIAALLDKAEALGLRVIVDLVTQHTSIDHRWFQEARHDRKSPYRDYYVWADEPEETEIDPIFPTQEESVWEWDEEAQQFYRHAFYDHEPDLELGNPRVRDELYRIMAYWLRMGVAGFRVDAVPTMVERARAADPRQDGLWLLEDMREFVRQRDPEAVLLGEVDVKAESYADYLGNGSDRLTLALDFWKTNHIFLALARQEAEPLVRAIDKQPGPPDSGQYATFLRNHDELDLEQLSEEEQDEVLAAFAPDDDMRVFERGIRRRLAPMLGGDERRLAMAHALLLGLPGSPVLRYGDEIGMGDDLSRPERNAVRVPMQWSVAPQAGFSDADPERLVVPVLSGGQFGHERINVYDQMARSDSLLARVGHLVRTRLGSLEIGSGTCRPIDTGSPSVLCLCFEHEERVLVTSVNLSEEPADCRIDEPELSGLVDVLSDDDYPRAAGDPTTFRLNGYGYRWLRRLAPVRAGTRP